VVHDGTGVVPPSDASARLLQRRRGSKKWLKNILLRILTELGQELTNVVAIRIRFLPKGYGAIHTEVLVEEAQCAQPLPVPIVHGEVGIEQP